MTSDAVISLSDSVDLKERPSDREKSITLFVSLISYSGFCSSSPIVSKVSPRDIGRGGGVITIEGAGFSEDVFNQFDPVLGNKVLFIPFLPEICKYDIYV